MALPSTRRLVVARTRGHLNMVRCELTQQLLNLFRTTTLLLQCGSDSPNISSVTTAIGVWYSFDPRRTTIIAGGGVLGTCDKVGTHFYSN